MRCFVEEPAPSLGFVNPYFKQAGGGHIAVFVASIVNLSHRRREMKIVRAQLCEHILWFNEVRVVIGDPLEPPICPIEQIVVPPSLRALSAIGSLIAKIWSDCSSSSR